jgi:hypothetical protein
MEEDCVRFLFTKISAKLKKERRNSFRIREFVANNVKNRSKFDIFIKLLSQIKNLNTHCLYY